ncbi:MAG: phage tail protein [Bradymonadales bacterium]|nr:MAG: phage tail protein [Bradymonadales bacterium]
MSESAEAFSVAKFEVNLEGLQAKDFSSVSGLAMSTEALPLQEGAMHEKTTRKGRTRYRNLSLSRIFTGDKELVQWFQRCARASLEKRSGSIILKDEDHREVLRFNVRQAWPIHWEGPDFFAQQPNQLAYETIVLDVEEIEVE